ncbi:DUF2691 family protein [Mycoplasmatota bacterium]|nr:DUF2691 family protein [Mycoplasmatota bacterium]
MDGIVMKFDSWATNIFKILFNDIDYSNWNIEIIYWESYTNNDSDLDKSDHFIKNHVFRIKNENIPEFAKILFSYKKVKRSTIETYEDFIESNWFMSMIIIDHRNIEICCKDKDLLKQIKKNFILSTLKNKRVTELSNIPLDAKLKAWRSIKEKSIYD